MIWTGGMLMAGMVIEAAIGASSKSWPKLPRPAEPIRRTGRALTDRLGQERGGWALAAGAVILGVIIAYLPGAPVWKVLLVAWLIEHRRTIDAMRGIANAFADSTQRAREAAEPVLGDHVESLGEWQIVDETVRFGCDKFTTLVVAPAFWFIVIGLPGMLLSLTVTIGAGMPWGAVLKPLDRVLGWVPERLSALLLALGSARPAALGALRAKEPAQTALRQGLRLPDGPRPQDIAPVIGLLWRAWSVLFGLAGIYWVSF
jgi:adenosylcobinamide-phosphate synthase